MECKSDIPWGQLVSTSDALSDPVVIDKKKLVIGRSKGADLSLIGNKLVSGIHCVIERELDGSVWIQDTSSNGTLINYKEKLQGKKRKLHHGDEFHLVYRKNEDYLNVSYMYQDIAQLKAEEEEADETTEYSMSADDTSLTLPLTDSSPDPVSRKRNRSPDTKSPDESHVDEKKLKVATDSSEVGDVDEKEAKVDEKEAKVDEKEAKVDEKDAKVKEKDAKVDDTEVNKKEEEKKPEGETKEKKSTEGMEENLICIICQEILHDCISCQPCMHSFCGGCYSDWMKRSSECPACRLEVARVNKNHIVNNLVEVYLKEHPDRKRPQADLDELDKKNKITADMLKPPKPKRTMSEYIDDEEEDNDEDDDDESGLVTTSPFASGVLGGGLFTGGHPFTGMTTVFGGTTILRPPKTICRQCPEYKDDGTKSVIATAAGAVGGVVSKVIGMVTGSGMGDSGTDGGGPSTSAGPSTSTGGTATTDSDCKILPEAPPYKCNEDTQIHIMCQCCLQPMPDRRTERTTNEEIPHQQCTLCYRMYCHMYWGCRKDACLGCLGRFKDMTFGERILSTIVLDNTYESEILKDYLRANKLSVKDLLKECCVRLEAGDYTCMDQIRGFTRDTVTCYTCGLRNFKDLVYQYRKDIPDDDLSPAVRSRPKCYWGRNCRTQRGKMAHAAKYNHICDQTKS